MHHLTKKMTTLVLFAALILFPLSCALAGDLEPPSGPAPTMKTLQEIWDKLEEMDARLEPGSGPGSVNIPRTGQATSYGDRDDGALQKGVAWPGPRFTDNNNGTVTDNLTNLVWLKNAGCFGGKTWATALADANGLAHGQCGLTDGSEAGDWWLPNIRQLQSLVDYGRSDPALPSGHPFTGVQSSYYWSSTSNAANTDRAWDVRMTNGVVSFSSKTVTEHVWPVRAGQ
ncbi:MAG: DUF1566 domain-containing protein [Desulfovibrionales bacterium]|nr:MAG: DUF1566 domain-containing protein [Desulfovibrionales bacterium]